MITLKKTPGKDFLVLNLSDPQLGNAEWADGGNCRFLLKTVRELVERVHPDLITVSGDLAWAGEDESYDKLAALLDSFGIPWAPVWGNHDNQNGPEYIDTVADRFLTHPLCKYEKGDPAVGNGNYILRIEQNGRLVSAILMMDSHDRELFHDAQGNEQFYWAKLPPAHIEWYRQQILALADEGCRDTAMIMHIPFYAYRDASKAAFKEGIDLRRVTPAEADGTEVWNKGYENSFGVQYEAICSYEFDDGVFPVVRDLGSTKCVIVGHDHINNWVIDYEGVKLVYSLKAGCGCYWNPMLNGGTVMTVGDDGIKGVHHEYVDVSDLL